MYDFDGNISIMQGETLVEVQGLHKGSEEVVFITKSGKRFKMWHEQDCCERVTVEDVVGEVDSLLNQPLLKAEQVSNRGTSTDDGDSYTWTFYTLATIRGYVSIRWYGVSNGYYSERVSFKLDVPEFEEPDTDMWDWANE